MDRLEDDVIFDVADIHAGYYSSFLKSPGMFEGLKYLQNRVEKEARNRDGDKRYSPDGHVYQTRLNPPCYRISQRFKGIRKLCEELELDLTTDNVPHVYSKLIAGGDYVWALDENYSRYQRYTVEVFGLLVTFTGLTEVSKRQKLPDPRQYATPPKYWYESPLELIQIWRTRIFYSAPRLFNPSLSNPLTPHRPRFPYLEERWHPSLAPITFGVEGIDKSAGRPRMQSQFVSDAYKILMQAPTTSGRPRIYKTSEEFYLEVRKVYRQLARKSDSPQQKEVALRLKLSLSSFSRYWSDTEIRWEDAHETLKSELIPSQILNTRFD